MSKERGESSSGSYERDRLIELIEKQTKIIQALYVAMQKKYRAYNLQDLEIKGHMMIVDRKLELIEVQLTSLEMVVDTLILDFVDKKELEVEDHVLVVA